ncbi:extracellular solute-binding protein [Streptomyces sp. DSM 44915]|uniref:Extracellular solute-binding protein n=1 Tax=Streptomyces chisholmiae TaxID=3075540 RepID=A0ABU2JXP2_9ACTN|nr:extracellular solute-binding protein [Streptomyces sp. DSM 44915]MDT0269717.1 extracellular solute-binding protein [Streptomyces sp. DSM 44915]
MNRRAWLKAASGGLLSLPLAACGLDLMASSGDSLTIYTCRPEAISEGVIAAFERSHPRWRGKVRLLTMGAQDVVARVGAEAARPQADVWWGGTQQQFEQGVADQLLTPAPRDVIEPVPAEYRGADDLWLGEMRVVQVIFYNPEMLTPEQAPADWDDLVSPDYRGDILIRDVASSGTMRGIYCAMIWRVGQPGDDPGPGYEWLRRLDANTKAYTANPTDLYLRVHRQEAAISLWNLQDTLIQRELGMSMTPVIPASGAPMLADGVGKIRNGPNSEGADDFLRFLMSAETQQGLADDFFQYPTVDLVRTPSWLEEFDVREMPVDWTEINRHQEEWFTYWAEHIQGRG